MPFQVCFGMVKQLLCRVQGVASTSHCQICFGQRQSCLAVILAAADGKLDPSSASETFESEAHDFTAVLIVLSVESSEPLSGWKGEILDPV